MDPYIYTHTYQTRLWIPTYTHTKRAYGSQHINTPDTDHMDHVHTANKRMEQYMGHSIKLPPKQITGHILFLTKICFVTMLTPGRTADFDEDIICFC